LSNIQIIATFDCENMGNVFPLVHFLGELLIRFFLSLCFSELMLYYLFFIGSDTSSCCSIQAQTDTRKIGNYENIQLTENFLLMSKNFFSKNYVTSVNFLRFVSQDGIIRLKSAWNGFDAIKYRRINKFHDS
jgi:hypothetical protein